MLALLVGVVARGLVMLRIVFVVLIVLAVWVLVMKLYNAVKGANVDWTGVSFVIGFIVLAFWLRHVTGIG